MSDKNFNQDFSWGTFYAHRKEFRKRHPSVYGLKVEKKLLDVITEELRGNESILDVGASTRTLGERVKSFYPDLNYKTMDVDPAGDHDYKSIEEIDEKFELIILSEVIEHLEFNDGMKLLADLKVLLASGGRLVISTPNMNHPNRYWADSDHKTPYMYDEFGGALGLAGYDVDKMYRIYNDSFFARIFRLYVMAPLHRYLDVDFATSIVAVAKVK
jgi:SAM-dependent methyltransferase